MADKLPKICIFGARGIELFSSPECPQFETRALDCRCYETDDDLEQILARERPNVIVTIGESTASFRKLNASASDIGRRWIHFESTADLTRMGWSAFYCFV